MAHRSAKSYNQAFQKILIKTFAQVSLVIIVLGVLGNFLFGFSWIRFAIYVLSFGLQLSVFLLAISNRIHLSSILQVGVGWFMATFVIFTSGADKSPLTSIYLIIILMAALLFNIRLSIVISLLSGLSLVVAALLNQAELLPLFLIDSNSRQVAALAISFSLIAICTAFAIQRLRHALNESNDSRVALAASEARYRTLVENIQDAVITCDLEGNINSWSQSAERKYGFHQEEVLGKNISELLQTSFSQESQQEAKKQLFQEGHFQDIVRQRHKSGHWLDISMRITVLYDEEGKARATLGINRDISELVRQREEVEASANFLQQALDAHPHYVFVKDQNGVFSFANKATADYYGLSPQTLIGKHERELDHQDNETEMFLALDQSVIKQKEAILDLDLKHLDPVTGQSKWFSTTKVPLFSKTNDVLGVLTATTDITARKQAEQNLRAMSRRIVTLQEDERRAIARELHDEIGQSLTALKVALHASIRSSTDSVEPALKLVDELLSQVRGLSLNLHPALLEDLGLEEALRHLYLEQTTRANIDLSFHYKLQSKVSAELEMALYRIAQEALTNVIRHAKASKLMLSLEETLIGIRLSIEDNGVGFDTEAEHLSLGLLNMQERTILLGGDFSISSYQSQGTSVTALFPNREVIP